MCKRHTCNHNLANLIRPPSNETTRTDPNVFGQAPLHGTPDLTKAQGRKKQMNCMNVHKAPMWSQLSKFDTAALKRNDPTRTRLVGRPDMVHPNKQRHKGENGKWTARTCKRHPCGHNLENLIRSPSNKTT